MLARISNAQIQHAFCGTTSCAALVTTRLTWVAPSPSLLQAGISFFPSKQPFKALSTVSNVDRFIKFRSSLGFFWSNKNHKKDECY